MINYYDILNLNYDCSIKDINNSYLKLKKKYKNTQNIDIINKAYEILSDPYKRGRYDQILENKSLELSLTSKLFNNYNTFNNFTNFFDDSIIDSSLNNNSFSSKSESYSYININGKQKVSKSYSSNINGKKKEYYQEYDIDKNGNPCNRKNKSIKNKSIKNKSIKNK